MSEIYIFSQDDDLLTILSESTGLISAPFKDHLNSVPDEPFVFTVDADEERAKHVKEENRVVFKDKDGFFREMVIKEIDDIDNNDGPQTTATCLPAWLDELSEHYVLDKRYTDKEAQLALDDALAGTRYIGEVEVSLGLASTNFYKLTSSDCIWKIINVWGGEFKDTIEFTGNKITTRKILIKQRLGADNGAGFEIDYNIDEIQRTILSYPKTAMYGWGASLEIEDDEGNLTGGHTRYIDFADVEWSVAKGDPADKPKGQKWVGDPDALQKYGRKHEGELIHREAEFSNQEIEDPEELLWATWNNLQEAKKPEVNYRLSVDMLDKDASLGDTARAIDREFARPIEIQTRVIAIEYDLLDIEGTAVVEMGQFLDLDDDRLDRLGEYIEENQGKWGAEAGPITNDRFPDIRPGIPSNVEAYGAFQTIQLFWDYGSEVYISHYEVYGSQVKDFVPDTQHLLWRGRVSAFNHEVDTDQTWYYRVRAVNTRGTASDYSPQVSASTARIITDDILFGSIIADHLENNLDIADKLAQNTIDRINEGPLKEIVYTQQQIEATEERLSKELNNRIGDVSASIDDLLEKTEGIEGSVTKIIEDIDSIEGKMSLTIQRLTNLDGTVSEQALDIKANSEAITFKANKDEVVDKSDYNSQMAQIDLRFDAVTTRVSNTETSINSLTGEIDSAKSEIAEIKVEAGKIETNVSSLTANLGAGKNFTTSKTISSSGWYRIASNTGNRAFARFIIKDVQNSKHMTAVFNAGITYGKDANVTLTGFSNYGSTQAVTKVRIVHNSTYDPPYLEIYVNAPAIIEIYCLENIQEAGWAQVNFTNGAIPSGYSSKEFNINSANLVDVTGENTAKDTKNVNGIASSQITTRISNAETNISQNATQIGLRATKTEVDGLGTRLSTAESTLKVMPEQIDLKVTRGLNSLQIGGRNLLINSNNFDRWYAYQGAVLTKTKVDMTSEWGFSEAYRFRITGGSGVLKTLYSTNTVVNEPLVLGETYTYSIYIKNMGNQIARVWLNGLAPTGNSQVTDVKPGESTRVVMSGKRREDYDWFQARLQTMDVSHNIDVIVGREQIERGDKVTDWSPAIEDMVGVDNVLASINLSKEGVRISGNKIHLTGQSLIDDAIIGTAAIANLSVTNQKIANLAVGTGQIQNLAVTNGKIANLAVDDAKIADLSVTKLKAGTLDTGKVKVRGGSSTDYSLIDGSTMELRGRFNRTWQGSTTTHDVKTRLQNGHLRFRNDNLNRSLYLSEFGFSTYVDGEGELGGSSGTILWWDKTYSPSNSNGITMHSHGGVVALASNTSHVVIDSYQSASIESKNSNIFIRPYTEAIAGSSVFSLTLKDTGDVPTADTDGFIMFGSQVTGYGVGLRFAKRAADPVISVVDTNYARGGNTTFDVGNLKVNDIEKRTTNTSVYWNASSNGNTGVGAKKDVLWASGIRALEGSADIFLATNNGAVRVTDHRGYNEGKGITYKPIAVERVAQIPQATSLVGTFSLMAAKPSENEATELIAGMDLIRVANGKYPFYEVFGESAISADLDEGGNDIGKAVNLLLKSSQELNKRVSNIGDDIDWLKLENQYLKQKINQLEEKVA